jgi:hypothetical protein
MVGVSAATANRDTAPHSDSPATDFERKHKHRAPAEWHRGIPGYRLGPGGSGRVEWPAGLMGTDSLPLVFPPGGGPA